MRPGLRSLRSVTMWAQRTHRRRGLTHDPLVPPRSSLQIVHPAAEPPGISVSGPVSGAYAPSRTDRRCPTSVNAIRTLSGLEASFGSDRVAPNRPGPACRSKRTVARGPGIADGGDASRAVRSTLLGHSAPEFDAIAAAAGSARNRRYRALGRSVIGVVSGCPASSFCATSTSSLSLAASLRRCQPQAPRRAPTRLICRARGRQPTAPRDGPTVVSSRRYVMAVSPAASAARG